MASDNLGEADRVIACRLIESALLNVPRAFEEAVPGLIEISMPLILGEAKTKALKLHTLETVINCVLYNPVLAISFLDSRSWTMPFFQAWFKNVDAFNRVHDKRLSIFALCALLEVPSASLPKSLEGGWSFVMSALMKMFQTLPKAEESESCRIYRFPTTSLTKFTSLRP